MKLHLGCGVNLLEGYINIDNLKSFNDDLNLFKEGVKDEGVNPDVDVDEWIRTRQFCMTDISEHLPFEDNSIDEILSSRFIGVVPFKISELGRVLKLGGKLTINKICFDDDFDDILRTLVSEGFVKFELTFIPWHEDYLDVNLIVYKEEV